MFHLQLPFLGGGTEGALGWPELTPQMQRAKAGYAVYRTSLQVSTQGRVLLQSTGRTQAAERGAHR